MQQNKHQKRDVNAAQRAALAVKMRATKAKYDDIAKACGYGSAGAAYKAVQRELQRTVVTNVEELRREELDSLDHLEIECWKRLYDKNYEKSMLIAVDRINQIKERRAKLMGLDKPVDTAVNAGLIVVREVPSGYLSCEAKNEQAGS
jgi:hypothetical protein